MSSRYVVKVVCTQYVNIQERKEPKIRKIMYPRDTNQLFAVIPFQFSCTCGSFARAALTVFKRLEFENFYNSVCKKKERVLFLNCQQLSESGQDQHRTTVDCASSFNNIKMMFQLLKCSCFQVRPLSASLFISSLSTCRHLRTRLELVQEVVPDWISRQDV